MLLTIIISSLTCLLMILAVLFLPKIKICNTTLSSYWIITFIGAVLLVVLGLIKPTHIVSALFADTAINPLKILVLFISMTILSIYLDELGFFRYLANTTLRHAGNSQLKLFFILYITVSILTIFTSNDIIILSFTPFICYFAKNAKISPLPYLATEFIAANSWSMFLIIGNPTNIYLVTSIGGDFISYMKVMFLPTITCGLVSFIFLFLVFRNKLSTPMQATPENVKIEDKLSLSVGIGHILVCTILLAIGSYLGLEMWLISFFCAVSLLIFSIFIALVKKNFPKHILSCLKRAPWELIPFVISMFVMVETLGKNGVNDVLFNILNSSTPVWSYGITSFLASNLINNIPMSVLYSSIISNGFSNAAIYSTVVGSNLGACLTPIGALAGIMWSSILKEHNLKFGYVDFLKLGISVAIPSLITALLTIELIL